MQTILEIFMERHEKRIAQLPPIRCSDTLEAALMRLATRDDRKLTEYVRLVLERHCFGMAATLPVHEGDVD